MNKYASKLLTLIRSKIEVGAVVSLLVAVATYVGNFYYKSYFDFYFVDSADITIPLADSIRTFIILLVASSILVALVASAELQEKPSFGVALLENVPLFVILVLFSGGAIYIYWTNVESLSAWLSSTLKDSALRDQNDRITLQVTHFLKWALMVGPLAILTCSP